MGDKTLFIISTVFAISEIFKIKINVRFIVFIVCGEFSTIFEIFSVFTVFVWRITVRFSYYFRFVCIFSKRFEC